MTEVTTRIEAILSPLLEERERLSAERADLIRQRQAKDRDIYQIERVLKAAGYKPEKPRATRKGNGTGLHPVAAGRIEQIYEWCETHGGEEFSRKQVAEALGISETLVHNAFQRMRAESPPRIRLLGKDPTRKGTHLFAVNKPKEPTNGN